MMAKKNRQRSGRAKTLADHVGKITKPIFGVRGFADAAIINDWPSIAGEYLAEHSAPEKIHYSPGNKHKGILHLRIDNGGLAIYVQHQGDVLIEKINSYFGYAAVQRIHINQGPLPETIKSAPQQVLPLPKAEERRLLKNLNVIDDEKLHQALEGLGRAVLGKTLKGSP